MSVQIKETTTELAKSLKKGIEIDPKTGAATIAKDLYIKHLPDGLTEETYKQLSDYNTQFTAAATLAAGQSALDHGKKLKADKIEFSFPMVGKDSLDLVWHKRRETHNPQDPDQKIVKFGAIGTPSFSVHATKNSGQLGAVRTHLTEEAAKIFAD
jgi:hypothetical protein